ncbi:MAG: hypothetical protein JHC84_12985 [Solirubrobacteraceae bacterium]|nr:hypothetical protein [Solirubrobacteraceae bacterium]
MLHAVRLVLLSVFAVLAAAAPAAATPLRIIEDDRLTLLAGPEARDDALDLAVDLGADVVRVQVVWRRVQPTRDGPRDWAAFDELVAAARARGLRPLLVLTSPAPAWAAGTIGEFHSVRPDVAAYERFVAEAGRRYPQVRLWQLWNEPNHPEFLAPQRSRDGTRLAPALYRTLLRAGGRALAATGHARDTILIGPGLPVGSDGRCASCTQRPMAFARELLCLDDRYRPLRGRAARGHPGCGGRFARLPGTGWAIHGYVRARDGAFALPPTPDDLSPAYLDELQDLLREAGRLSRLRPGMPVWDTENGVQSRPEPRGVTQARQAQLVNELEFIAWRTPGVRSHTQYAIRDDAAITGFQSGLFLADGRPKALLAAYRLPVVALPRGRGLLVWGRVPRAGRVAVLGPDGRVLTARRASRYFAVRVRRVDRVRLRFEDGALSRWAAPSRDTQT